MNLEKIRSQLILHEDFKLKPYKDTVGKITIGVGRNLDDVGISREEALMMLDNDITTAVNDAEALFHGFAALDEVRQRVLVDMAFNLGRVRLSLFKKLRKAVNAKMWSMAAREMKASRWHVQVGRRAERLEEMMKTGHDY